MSYSRIAEDADDEAAAASLQHDDAEEARTTEVNLSERLIGDSAVVTETAGEVAVSGESPMDGYILMITKFLRMISYGACAVALFIGLEDVGLSDTEITTLFGLTLLGDLLLSFPLTTRADRWGRKRVLVVSSLLKIFSGIVFASSKNYYFLVFAGVMGVITPTGGEIGPFTAVESAAMTEILPKITSVSVSKLFAWYSLIGYTGQALGAVMGGYVITLHHVPSNATDLEKARAYQDVFYIYAALGGVMALLYLRLSSAVESPTYRRLHHGRPDPLLSGGDSTSSSEADLPSRVEGGACVKQMLSTSGLSEMTALIVVVQLSLLFMVDSFGGGFVMQSVIVKWFEEVYNMDPDQLGLMLAGANILSALSALAVPYVVGKIGPVKTMVFTHIPSNLLLIAVVLVNAKTPALALLLLRFSLSQMDVPARNAFVALSVKSEDRSAAGGITNLVRSMAVSLSPFFLGPMLDQGKDSFWYKMPFIVAGTLKTLYDVSLYLIFGRGFQAPQHGGGH